MIPTERVYHGMYRRQEKRLPNMSEYYLYVLGQNPRRGEALTPSEDERGEHTPRNDLAPTAGDDPSGRE